MKSSEFKGGISIGFESIGLIKTGNILVRRGPGVALLVDFDKGFGEQWFINIGIFIGRLGSNPPSRIEKCHMYYRLERLCPDLREITLAAGDMGDSAQESFVERLLDEMPNSIKATLTELGEIIGLSNALQEGRLEGGCVTREARDYLTSKSADS